MASILTLEGVDNAISNLNYSNEKTLKYRFVHYIRQFYSNENAVESVEEIGNEELIKILWDTGDSPEAIKSKRKNLNGLRSSVNADFKKLYDKGENSEGIKIGPGNIFVMLDDAKDKILKEFGYDLQPDGTLKLDQIMDILRLANETVSGSMADEEKVRKDGLSKIDQVRDLIKGLSEKLGLAGPEVVDEVAGEGEVGEEFEEVKELEEDEVLEEVDDLGEVTDEVAGEGEVGEGLEEVEELEEDEVLEEVNDLGEAEDGVGEEFEEVEELEEDEVLEEVDDLGEVEDGVSGEGEVGEEFEEVEELEEDEVLEEVDDLGEVTDGVSGEGEVGEEFEEVEELEEDEVLEKVDEIGLPVDSLGAEYPDEVSDKIKKDTLLSEEFDGYLGVMDRYYNHYILIPEGEYVVGSKQPKKDEKSEHLVSLLPFYIGRFPVSNGLFEIFVEKTGYKTMAEKVGYGSVYYGRCQRKKDETTGLITSTWNSTLYCKTVEGANWYQPCGPGSTLYNKRNHPVVQICLEDAMAFAAWTGKRLPTEDEWEAASRTAEGWIFPWGKEWKKDSCNIEDSYTGDTTSVDKYAKFENDFGIVDTIGNILEWTMDEFKALSDNKNRSGYHIAKGGSWISGDDIRLFSRFKIEPESHSNILGFRCVAH